MAIPDWRTSTAGTRVRVALWLHSVVGEGGTFRKAQLRDAFPNVEQVDRRMRDLRPEGWVIATYREDRSLASDELRLVQEGGPVWEGGYVSQASQPVSDKERRAIFAADIYQCMYCGIAAGDAYPDDRVRTAKLTLARATTATGRKLVTCCDRCHVGDGLDDDRFQADFDRLSPDSRARLVSWVRRGSREWTPEEQLWARFQRLPAETRTAVRGELLGPGS